MGQKNYQKLPEFNSGDQYLEVDRYQDYYSAVAALVIVFIVCLTVFIAAIVLTFWGVVTTVGILWEIGYAVFG